MHYRKPRVQAPEIVVARRAVAQPEARRSSDSAPTESLQLRAPPGCGDRLSGPHAESGLPRRRPTVRRLPRPGRERPPETTSVGSNAASRRARSRGIRRPQLTHERESRAGELVVEGRFSQLHPRIRSTRPCAQKDRSKDGPAGWQALGHGIEQRHPEVCGNAAAYEAVRRPLKTLVSRPHGGRTIAPSARASTSSACLRTMVQPSVELPPVSKAIDRSAVRARWGRPRVSRRREEQTVVAAVARRVEESYPCAERVRRDQTVIRSRSGPLPTIVARTRSGDWRAPG